MALDRTASPKSRVVAFGSAVPGDGRKASRRPSAVEVPGIGIFEGANDSSSPAGSMNENQAPASRSPSHTWEGRRGSTAGVTRSPSRMEPSPDLHESRWKSSASPGHERQPTSVKITYSHIGTVGSEDVIRSRLRQTLSMSSVRIEPENDHVGLSATEVRLLVEV